MAHAERRIARFVLLRPFAFVVIALGVGVKTLAAGPPFPGRPCVNILVVTRGISGGNAAGFFRRTEGGFA